MAIKDTTNPVPTVWPTSRSGKRRGWNRYSNRTFFLFIGPWLFLGFFGLTLIPLIYGLGLSFTNFDGISPRWHFLGFNNYTELIGDPDTWSSLTRSILYMVISVPLSVGIGIGLAVMLNQKIRGIAIFRSLFYLPAIVPVVASAIVWKQVFDLNAGIVNGLTGVFGLPAVSWLIDPWAFVVLIMMVLWGAGGGMVIFLAALQGIPAELREAAQCDGANPWQSFRAITLPLLTPVIFFQVVTGIIFSLQTLVQPLLLAGTTAGAPATVPSGNHLYMVNVYEQIFSNQRLGYGAALLWLLIAFMLIITIVLLRSGSLWVYYEVDQDRG